MHIFQNAKYLFKKVCSFYRDGSLQRKNAIFLGIGMTCGVFSGLVEKFERKKKGILSDRLSLSFYNSDLALEMNNNLSKSRREFENAWNRRARLFQKQRGYLFTKMFRLVPQERLDFNGYSVPSKTSPYNLKSAYLIDATSRKPSGAVFSQSSERIPAHNKNNSNIRNRRSLPFYIQLQKWVDAHDEDLAVQAVNVITGSKELLTFQHEVSVFRNIFDDSITRLVQ